ncbi:MAG: hypothetical protein ABXS92_00955 [Sulfurimonas sp.]
MKEKELKELLKNAKESLDKVENHVESLTHRMNKDINTFWGDLKVQFGETGKTLTNAAKKLEDETELQGKLGVMEAHEQAKKIQSTSEEFIRKITAGTQQELDLAALRAHLAKMEAADLWKEQEPDLAALYHDSKEEFENMAKNAGRELNDILLKLTEIR